MVSSGVEAATAFVPAAESSAADLLPLLVAVHFLLLQILPGDIKSASHDGRHCEAPQIISLLALLTKKAFLQTELLHTQKNPGDRAGV